MQTIALGLWENENEMTLSNIVALFGAMVVLAAIPSFSVLIVVSRSITFGFASGLMTTIGIVLGDMIFIVLAIYGLSAISETMSNLLVLIKYLGGIYLVWLGIGLSRSRGLSIKIEEGKNDRDNSLLSSFLTGLLVTLGDQKAIFFYISFFPAFIDSNTITVLDTIAIISIAILTIGGIKVAYVYMADKAKLLLKDSMVIKTINLIAGTLMIAAGIFLIAKN